MGNINVLQPMNAFRLPLASIEIRGSEANDWFGSHQIVRDDGTFFPFAKLEGYPAEERRKVAAMFVAAPGLARALQAALPVLRREFMQLAEKYAGTRFESDPAYRAAESKYRDAEAALRAAGLLDSKEGRSS